IAQRGGPKLTALVARRDRQGPVCRRCAGSVDGSIGTAQRNDGAAVKRNVRQRFALTWTELDAEYRQETAEAEQWRETRNTLAINEQRSQTQRTSHRMRDGTTLGRRRTAQHKETPDGTGQRFSMSLRLRESGRRERNIAGSVLGECRARGDRVVTMQ